MVGEGKAAPVKFELKKPALSTLAQRQRSARLRRDPPAEGRPVSRPSALADPATLGNEGQAGAEAGMFAMLDRIEVKITDTLRKTSGSLAARKRSEPAAAAGGANGLPASGTGSTSRAKPGGSSAVPAAGRSGAFPCLRLRLLPTYLAIEEAGLALPYSAETLRFLRQVEAGRLPWHYLRSLPKLWEHVEKMFMEGCLDVEVHDLRSPETCLESSALASSGCPPAHRALLSPDTDTTLSELSRLSAAAAAAPWSRAHLLKVEAHLLRATAPPPCIKPGGASFPLPLIGRLINLLQYDRLKLHLPALRGIGCGLRANGAGGGGMPDGVGAAAGAAAGAGAAGLAGGSAASVAAGGSAAAGCSGPAANGLLGGNSGAVCSSRHPWHSSSFPPIELAVPRFGEASYLAPPKPARPARTRPARPRGKPAGDNTGGGGDPDAPGVRPGGRQGSAGGGRSASPANADGGGLKLELRGLGAPSPVPLDRAPSGSSAGGGNTGGGASAVARIPSSEAAERAAALDVRVCFPLLTRLHGMQEQQNAHIIARLPQATEALNRVISDRNNGAGKRPATMAFLSRAVDKAAAQGLLRPEALWPRGYRAARAARALQSEPRSASASFPSAGSSPPSAKRQRSSNSKKGGAISTDEPVPHSEVLSIHPADGGRGYDAEVFFSLEPQAPACVHSFRLHSHADAVVFTREWEAIQAKHASGAVALTPMPRADESLRPSAQGQGRAGHGGKARATGGGVRGGGGAGGRIANGRGAGGGKAAAAARSNAVSPSGSYVGSATSPVGCGGGMGSCGSELAMLQHAATAAQGGGQAPREPAHLGAPAVHSQLRMAQQQALIQQKQREALVAQQARLRQQQAAAGGVPMSPSPPHGMGGGGVGQNNFLREVEEHMRLSRDNAAPGLAPS